MKKRYGMWTAMLAVLLAAALLAAGCGGSGKDAGAETTAVTADTSSGSMMEMGAPEEAVAESEAVNGQIASSSGIDSVDTTAQKLIKTVNLTMQTREFDTLAPLLDRGPRHLFYYAVVYTLNILLALLLHRGIEAARSRWESRAA